VFLEADGRFPYDIFMTNSVLPLRPPRWARQDTWLLCVSLILAAATTARADVINLKNGRQIVGRVKRQDAMRVYYEHCGVESSVLWSEVERIDSFSDPAGESTAGGDAREAGCKQPFSVQLPAQALAPVVKEGVLDEAYLLQLDARLQSGSSAANRRLLTREYEKAAYFLAAKGDSKAAIEKVRHALELVPAERDLTVMLGSLYIAQNRQREAIELLQPALQCDPRSPDLRFQLGWAYYSSENLDQAITEWKKGLALRDDPTIREMLAKAQREQDVTKSYRDLASSHFLLNFEGGQGSTLGREVLDALEADFRLLETDLGVSPAEKIVVILYPSQDFRDITRSPSWVGALNDGKIRVPVSGLSTVTPGLARVLKHELTHSFVRQATLGRCPVWFNEGLAQLEEGSSTEFYGKQLVQVFDRVPRYSSLQRSFVELPALGATAVYAKSLAALEYVRDTYGRGEIRQMLGAMAANPDFDTVLQLELRVTYPNFEKDVGAYLRKRYGS